MIFVFASLIPVEIVSEPDVVFVISRVAVVVDDGNSIIYRFN